MPVDNTNLTRREASHFIAVDIVAAAIEEDGSEEKKKRGGRRKGLRTSHPLGAPFIAKGRCAVSRSGPPISHQQLQRTLGNLLGITPIPTTHLRTIA
jgi:hypothetical protein